MKILPIIFLLFSVAAQAESCVPSVNSCDFYKCKEQERNCGRKGYLIAFGHKYCRAFLHHQKSFDSKAQDWLQKVRVALQTEILYIPDKLSCQAFEDAAFASHVGVYRDSGFCDLSWSSKFQILGYFDDLFFDSRFIETALEIDAACSFRD
jgi:hypothetical protein